LLLRNKFTRDQVKLTREARHENLAEAFSVAPEARALPHAVMLVDDVVTTGATFDAAARALRRIRKDITIWGIAAAYHATP
jgi:predicted amidophosphoribosyltransferase